LNLDRYSDNFFQVNHINGFLPKKSPIAVLPKRYSDLQILIDDMPIKKANGENGLLAEEGAIEDAVKNLKNYKELVKDEDDVFINQALFRAYAFLTSAYLLAPSHFGFQKTKKYGKAHTILPSQLAEPFVIVSKKLDVYPFLDYHYAYSLGNYVKIDNAKGYEWENLAMAAKFSGMDDERGFIMLHVDINQYSPQLVGSILEFLNSKNSNDVSGGLFDTEVSEDDISSGFIYICKSKSDKEEIKSIADLYKIGFSKDVDNRIKNAENDPTYLMAPVSLITYFECYNFNSNKLENLLHKFFSESCLDIDIYDNEGAKHKPREWFVAPLHIIEKVIELIINGTIVNYKYDVVNKMIVKK